MRYPKYVSDTIDDIDESDFNPDIVIPGIEDCYCYGVAKGFIIGVASCGIIALANKGIKMIMKKRMQKQALINAESED